MFTIAGDEVRGPDSHRGSKNQIVFDVGCHALHLDRRIDDGGFGPERRERKLSIASGEPGSPIRSSPCFGEFGQDVVEKR